MADFDPVDKWFESGFRIRRQAVRNAPTVKYRRVNHDTARRVGGSPPKRGGVALSSGSKARNVKNTIKKAPQVMVKITGNSSGMNQAKNHIDYISRNGDYDLINEQGEVISGHKAVKSYKRELLASGIPNESRNREFIHVMLSMPEGTSEESFKQSVMDFSKEEFSNRQYAVAFHDDTDHVHAHVLVNTRDIDRANEPRLNPKKADLMRWRQGFADKLNGNGIEASASYRAVRFNYKRSEKAAIRQIRGDNPDSVVFNKGRADRSGGVSKPRIPTVYKKLSEEISTSLDAKKRPANPALSSIEKTRKAVLDSWNKVAENLENSGDQSLADKVRDFVATSDKPIISRNQSVYDQLSSRESDISQDSPQQDIDI